MGPFRLSVRVTVLLFQYPFNKIIKFFLRNGINSSFMVTLVPKEINAGLGIYRYLLMGEEIDQTGTTSRRLNIDRKMIGILSIFTILGVFLVISIIIATNTLSALRGFATLQTHWTEARKEATLQLTNYLRSGEEHHYVQFDSALGMIYSGQEIRI